MKNNGQPIRESVPWNSRCTKDPCWLNNIFLFSTEIWAEQLKKHPVCIITKKEMSMKKIGKKNYYISYDQTSLVFLTWALQPKIPLLLGSWTRCRHWTSRWFCWSRSWPRQRQPGSTWSATSRKQRLTSNLEFGTLCRASHRGLYYFQKSGFC